MIFLTLFKLQYDPSRTPHRNFINDLLAEYEISANSVYQDASQQLDGFLTLSKPLHVGSQPHVLPA
jgi:hypothetical protein